MYIFRRFSVSNEYYIGNSSLCADLTPFMNALRKRTIKWRKWGRLYGLYKHMFKKLKTITIFTEFCQKVRDDLLWVKNYRYGKNEPDPCPRLDFYSGYSRHNFCLLFSRLAAYTRRCPGCGNIWNDQLNENIEVWESNYIPNQNS